MMVETARLEAVFTADTKDFDKGVKRVDKTFGDLSKDMGKGLRSIGSGITGLSRDIVSLTAPISAGFGIAIKSAMDFDNSITNIGAIMGRTSDEMFDLRDAILDIGSASTFGAQATADAFAEIAGGVLDTSTHMEILTQAIATAEAGQADLQATTAGLVSTMNSYAFGVEDVARVSDVMTQTVGMGVGSMNELADAMPMVTGLAASLGISFEEIGGSMAFLSTKGFSFAQAGTQLRAMMTALLNPNEKMRAALAELNVETGQALIETHGLVGAYELLAGTDMAQTEFAAMLGSTEALTGATALLSEEAGGASVFMDTFADSLAGATERAREIQLQSTRAQFDKLKASVGGISIRIGSALLPVLNDLVDDLIPVVEAVADWIDANPDLVRQLAQVVTVLGGLALVMFPIQVGMSALSNTWAILSGAATLLKGAVLLLGGALSPILIPIAGLIAAGAGLLTLLGGEEGLVGGFKKAATAAQQLVELGIHFVKQAFEDFVNSPLFATLRGLFETAFAIGGDILEGVIAFFGSVIQEIINFTQSPFFQAIIDVFEGAFALGGDILEGVIAFFGDVIQEIINFTESPFFQTIIDVFEGAFALGGDILEGVIGFFDSILQGITDFTQSPLFDAIVSVFENAFGLVGDLVDMLIGTIGTIANGIQTVIDSPVFQAIVGVFTDIFEVAIKGIIDGVTSAIEGIVGFIQSVVDSPVFQAVLGVFTDIFNSIDDIILGVVNTIDSIITSIRDMIGSDVFVTIENIFRAAFDGIKNIVEGVVNSITGFLGGIQRTIEDVLVGLGLAKREAQALTAEQLQLQNTLTNNILPRIANVLSGGTDYAPTMVPRGNALGGNVSAGQWSWVGEDGPELVRFGASGTVFSNPRTPGGNNYGNRMLGGTGGGGGVTITGNITINGVQNVQQLYDELRRIGAQRGA